MELSHHTTLLLKYKKPFDFKQMLSFMKPRAMAGVEAVTDTQYARTYRTHEAKGFFMVKDNSAQSALELEIGSSNIKAYEKICNRVRRMFDLDTDFMAINAKFTKDRQLSKGMEKGHVPRLPMAFHPFEFVVRAILGQQISVKAATTLASRIAKKAALQSGNDYPTGLDYFFPDPAEILKLGLDGLGITNTRQATIKIAAQSILDKAVLLSSNQPFETFYKDFSSLKGIGDWTVHYVAMRGLGIIDSFPATDLGVIKALTGKGGRPSKKEILKMAENCRPYRSYATLCLWNSSEEGN